VIAVTAAAVLAAPVAAGAATPDAQILSATASRTSVPVGIPTQVTFTINIRNNGEATSAGTVSAGPVGGAPAFTNVDIQASNSGQDPDELERCDAPGGDAPRCRLAFVSRPQTRVVEVTDTVVAPAAGTVTRTFTADVVAPDVEGNGANNRMSVVLEAVPGALPAVSDVAIRGRSSLSAKQRKRAIGTLRLTLNTDAELRLVVERRNAAGRYRRWGEITRFGSQGVNTFVLANRIDYHQDTPVDHLIRRMRTGRYRVTVVATDAEGHTSRPVSRTFVVPRKR
jgi:hypothetical protein